VIWIYNYMFNDYLSLLQLLVDYITRSISNVPISFTTYQFLYSIEAFFNVFDAYIQAYLLALVNIWRYFQIVRGSLLLCHSRYHLFSAHILLYGFVIIWFFLERYFNFSCVVHKFGVSCYSQYPFITILIIDSIIGLIIPIILNIYFLTINILYIRNSQNIIHSVRRLHRGLIIQCLILYSIWFLLFIPKVIISLVMTPSIQQRFWVKMLHVIDIISDVLIITTLDKRFINLWKNLYHRAWHKIRSLAVIVKI